MPKIFINILITFLDNPEHSYTTPKTYNNNYIHVLLLQHKNMKIDLYLELYIILYHLLLIKKCFCLNKTTIGLVNCQIVVTDSY